MEFVLDNSVSAIKSFVLEDGADNGADGAGSSRPNIPFLPINPSLSCSCGVPLFPEKSNPSIIKNWF